MADNITELSIEQIEARIAEIVAEFTALGLSAESDEAAIAQGEALAGEVTALRAELAKRVEVQEAQEKRLASIAEAFAPTADDEQEDTVDERENPEPEAEPVVEDEPEEEPDEAPAPKKTPTAEVEDAQPVAAAATKPSPAKRAAAHAPEVKMPKSSSVAVITAAADVPNYASGHQFDDLDGAVDAVISRLRSLPAHHIPNTRLRYGALKIQMQGFGDLVQQAGMEDMKLINMAGDERRLSGGSVALTADAWCAPSETAYDFCSYETVTGLLSVPEVQVTRGGIRTTAGPSMADLADCAFHVDNDGAITDGSGASVTEKPCCDIPCPPFTDIRLEVDGICVKGDILQNVGYPELTRRYIELALIGHAKRMNAANIGAIVAAAGTPVAVPDNSTLLFNLDYLEWYAEAIRSTYSLAENASIETILPSWIKPLVRAEIGRRNGFDNINVPDALVNSWFTSRHLAPQFVRDWQATPALPAAVNIPATVNALMYPAGSWVRGTQGVISLDTVYDSVGLAVNKYTALFTEEASLMHQRCLGTANLTIPVSVSGLTGAQITAELGTAVVTIP
jgi:hypothetical protein